MSAVLQIRVDTKSPFRLACERALFEKLPADLQLERVALQDVAEGTADADLFIADFADIRHAKTYTALIAQKKLPCLAVLRDNTPAATELAMRLGAVDVISYQEISGDRIGFLIDRVACSMGAVPVSTEQKQVSVSELVPQKHEFIANVYEASMKLMERMPLSQLYHVIAEQTASLAQADSAFVSVLNETSDCLEIVGTCGDATKHQGFQHKLNEGVAGRAWQSQDIVVSDRTDDECELGLWDETAQRVAIPFQVAGTFTGVVVVAANPGIAELINSVDLVRLFQRAIATVCENAKLIADQHIEISRHVALSKLTQQFYEADDLSSLIDEVCQSLINGFDAKRATVASYDESKRKFSMMSDWLLQDGELQRVNFANHKLMSESASQWAIDNKSLSFTPRGENSQHDSATVCKMKSVLGLGSSVVLPLLYEQTVWGVLVISKSIMDRDFTEVEVSLLELLAKQLSSTVLRQNLVDKIHFQAYHDSLTLLPNRLRFETVLSSIVADSSNKVENCALLFLDLDGFKSVNDNQGHSIGDKLLCGVAKRLAGCLQDRDLLARMGGDEFAVLLRGVKSRDSALRIAMRLNKAIEQEFSIDKYLLKVGVSVGVSFFPDDGKTVEDLLRNADFAMYEAKSAGKNCVRCFNQVMANQYRQRLSLEADLICALELGQFELFYQPKVSLSEQRVVGVEALVRWHHPKLGFIAPSQFLSIAEEAGYIHEIGSWVLNEAVEQAAIWLKEGLPPLKMGINISSSQFVLEDFTKSVFEALEKYSLPANSIELEVTESIVMKNIDKVIATLTALRDRGICITIDDFGTGYSSLSCLEDLPLDYLKIDKTFVDKLDYGDAELSLVNTILSMARSLGLHSVAEGVERGDQVQKLHRLGCDYIQGYYFSKPLPAFEMAAAINTIESSFTSISKVS